MPSNFAEFEPNLERLGCASDFINEWIDAIEPHPLFEDFSREEYALLSNYLLCFGVPRQAVVIREGDTGDFLAILVTGSAVMLKTYAGIEKVVHALAPGEIFGETSLIDGQARRATCITTEPSDFAVLTRRHLDSMLDDHPRLGNKFLLMLLNVSANRLRNATAIMLPGVQENLA